MADGLLLDSSDCVLTCVLPCRVRLQYSCCAAHHPGLHVGNLSDLLQLLPGDLHTHPAAVCGPGCRHPLRRRSHLPRTTRTTTLPPVA